MYKTIKTFGKSGTRVVRDDPWAQLVSGSGNSGLDSPSETTTTTTSYNALGSISMFNNAASAFDAMMATSSNSSSSGVGSFSNALGGFAGSSFGPANPKPAVGTSSTWSVYEDKPAVTLPAEVTAADDAVPVVESSQPELEPPPTLRRRGGRKPATSTTTSTKASASDSSAFSPSPSSNSSSSSCSSGSESNSPVAEAKSSKPKRSSSKQAGNAVQPVLVLTDSTNAMSPASPQQSSKGSKKKASAPKTATNKAMDAENPVVPARRGGRAAKAGKGAAVSPKTQTEDKQASPQTMVPASIDIDEQPEASPHEQPSNLVLDNVESVESVESIESVEPASQSQATQLAPVLSTGFVVPRARKAVAFADLSMSFDTSFDFHNLQETAQRQPGNNHHRYSRAPAAPANRKSIATAAVSVASPVLSHFDASSPMPKHPPTNAFAMHSSPEARFVLDDSVDLTMDSPFVRMSADAEWMAEKVGGVLSPVKARRKTVTISSSPPQSPAHHAASTDVLGTATQEKEEEEEEEQQPADPVPSTGADLSMLGGSWPDFEDDAVMETNALFRRMTIGGNRRRSLHPRILLDTSLTNGSGSASPVAASVTLPSPSPLPSLSMPSDSPAPLGAVPEPHTEEETTTDSAPTCPSPVPAAADNSTNSHSSSLPAIAANTTLPLGTRLLAACGQTNVPSLEQHLGADMLKTCIKIGEGAYGEVFKAKWQGRDAAFKVVPIDGCLTKSKGMPMSNEEASKSEALNVEINGGRPLSVAAVLPEVIITRSLHTLRAGNSGAVLEASVPATVSVEEVAADTEQRPARRNGKKSAGSKSASPALKKVATSSNSSDFAGLSSTSFIELMSVHLCHGPYPKKLLASWDKYDTERESENDRPDCFNNRQLFVVFTFANGGRDLEHFEFNTLAEAKCVLYQVCLGIAVAEKRFKFEHRDLHWGNILIMREAASVTSYGMGAGQPVVRIDNMGLRASIIDFTLSRLEPEPGAVMSSNLSADPAIFEGEGDYQFDIYRKMRDFTGQVWEAFHPYTNVLWVHYLADKLINEKKYPSESKKSVCDEKRALRAFQKRILLCDSMSTLIDDPLFASLRL